MRFSLISSSVVVCCLALFACGDDAAEPPVSATGGAAGASGTAGAAGGAGNTSSVPTAITAEDCAASVEPGCQRMFECFPLEATINFPDVATCISASTTRCLEVLPNVGVTRAALLACTASKPSATCASYAELLADRGPAACLYRGEKLADEPCWANAECTTGRCEFPAGEGCGVCAGASPEGAACALDAECQPGSGLVCVDGVCTARLTEGKACEGSAPCDYGLLCLDGLCSRGGAAGDACTAARPCGQDLGCDTTTFTCRPWSSAALGSPCGFFKGAPITCIAPSVCHLQDTYTGVCEAPHAENESCDAESYLFGKACAINTTCWGGTCQRTTASVCAGD